MSVTHADIERKAVLTELAGRYVWWTEDGEAGDDIVIAQVMNLGTYDDIRRLEQIVTPSDLRAVMLRARAGWISPRSWGFWRGRLLSQGCGPIPENPPRRSFHADML